MLLCISVAVNMDSLHAQWIPTNGPYGGDITCFAVDSTTIFAGTYSGGVYLSTNNGQSWTAAKAGLINTNTLALATDGTNLYVGEGGYGGGVFVSTNNGTSWKAANTGLTNFNITALAVSAASGGSNLFAGTYGSGLWKRPVSQMITGVNDNNSAVPESFSLFQNYPNPFNPSTKIKFDIPETVKRKTLDVKLIIYNILGREIQTLVNESLKPGSYEVTFDGSNLPSGVYFYKLIAGNYVETKKMLMIK